MRELTPIINDNTKDYFIEGDYLKLGFVSTLSELYGLTDVESIDFLSIKLKGLLICDEDNQYSMVDTSKSPYSRIKPDPSDNNIYVIEYDCMHTRVRIKINRISGVMSVGKEDILPDQEGNLVAGVLLGGFIESAESYNTLLDGINSGSSYIDDKNNVVYKLTKDYSFVLKGNYNNRARFCDLIHKINTDTLPMDMCNWDLRENGSIEEKIELSRTIDIDRICGTIVKGEMDGDIVTLHVIPHPPMGGVFKTAARIGRITFAFRGTTKFKIPPWDSEEFADRLNISSLLTFEARYKEEDTVYLEST